jgi:hypothetical protein
MASLMDRAGLLLSGVGLSQFTSLPGASMVKSGGEDLQVEYGEPYP